MKKVKGKVKKREGYGVLKVGAFPGGEGGRAINVVSAFVVTYGLLNVFRL